MTIGIYAIVNLINDKKYIGKSINIESRWWQHNNDLSKDECPKDCNRHLYRAVHKHGLMNFEFQVLEKFEIADDGVLKDCELKWIDFYETCDRKYGYNLRRDSSTKCIVHDETIQLRKSGLYKGENNPNFGNRWNDQQKLNMSERQKIRHLSIEYTDEQRKSIGDRSKEIWKDLAKRKQMAENVSKSKNTHDFYQYDMQMNLIKVYGSIHQIIEENPTYKWQNIYAACNGNKLTYMRFQWKRKLKNHSI